MIEPVKPSETQQNITVSTTDFVLRQKTPSDPLEIWIDLLITDSVELGNNQMIASIKNSLLLVQVAPNVTREIALDHESQKRLITNGGVMVFCGPSGVIAKADLIFS